MVSHLGVFNSETVLPSGDRGQRPSSAGGEREKGSTGKDSGGPEGIPGWTSQPRDDR